MSMRIAIMGTRGIPNRYGGFEQLAEYLGPGLVERGHEVTVYNSHDHPFKLGEWKGVRIVHCYDPERKLGSAGQFIYDLNCIRDARKRKYDIILQLGYTSSSVWGGLLPGGVPVVYHLDGLEWQRQKYGAIARRFLRGAEKLAVRYSDFTITDSRAIQSYFYCRYGIESEYIAYGADSGQGGALDGETGKEPGCKGPEEYGLRPFDYFMLVARMEPENNIETILDGFRRSEGGKQMLVVGNMSNGYGKQLLVKYGSDERIRWAGGLFDMELLSALRASSYLYFHGHSAGGTNPSLLEAMASGALIAAHDNPFNREVLENNAFYFRSVGDVARIMDSVGRGMAEGAMIRNNCRLVAGDFTWERIIGRYERFLTGCIRRYREGGNAQGAEILLRAKTGWKPVGELRPSADVRPT